MTTPPPNRAERRARATTTTNWLRWVEKLRAIASEGTPVEPEIERGNGRLSASPSKATPGERANASTEGLTIDCKESRWL